MSTFVFALGVIVGAAIVAFVLLHKNAPNSGTARANASEIGKKLTKTAGNISSSVSAGVSAGVAAIREERAKQQAAQTDEIECETAQKNQREKDSIVPAIDYREWEEVPVVSEPAEQPEPETTQETEEWEIVEDNTDPEEWVVVEDTTETEEWEIDGSESEGEEWEAVKDDPESEEWEIDDGTPEGDEWVIVEDAPESEEWEEVSASSVPQNDFTAAPSPVIPVRRSVTETECCICGSVLDDDAISLMNLPSGIEARIDKQCHEILYTLSTTKDLEEFDKADKTLRSYLETADPVVADAMSKLLRKSESRMYSDFLQE